MQSQKFDPKVFQLGYVALGTPDIERAKQHYLQNLGMTEVAQGDDGSVYLSSATTITISYCVRPHKRSCSTWAFSLNPTSQSATLPVTSAKLGSPLRSRPTASPALPSWSRSRAGRLGHPVLQRDCSFRSRLQANRRSPLRLGHVAIINPEGDKADRVLPGLSRLRSHRRHRGDREFPHLQSRAPRRQYREGAGIPGPPHRLRAQGSSCHGIAADALREPASTFFGARRGTPRATTWPPITTTPTR